MLNNEQQKIKTDVLVGLQRGAPQLESETNRFADLIREERYAEALFLLHSMREGCMVLGGALQFLSEIEEAEGTSLN